MGTFVNLENGAHVRLSDLLKFLDEHFDNVTLYSYAHHGDCPCTDEAIKKFKLAFPRLKLCLEECSRPLRSLWKRGLNRRARSRILSGR